MMTTNQHQSHSVRKHNSGNATMNQTANSGQSNHIAENKVIQDSRISSTGDIDLESLNHIINEQNAKHDLKKTTTPEIVHDTIAAAAKEKTPMCLVNELARFNKIEHQYRLTSEDGPPHKKRFTVMLKLGDEEYFAEGPSIKKAQHSAAGQALKATRYRHPPPKQQRNRQGNVTPTVELNALAMKRGEPTVYTFVEPPIPNPVFNATKNRSMVSHAPPIYGQKVFYPPGYNEHYNANRGKVNNKRNVWNHWPPMNNIHHQKNGQVMPPNMPYPPAANMIGPERLYGHRHCMHVNTFKIRVRVGDKEFIGEASTPQAARHDAAAKALQVLRNLPAIDKESVTHTSSVTTADDAPVSENTTENKSPISLVHEIALKRNLQVFFEVEVEKGPPHMKTFVTRCSVGFKYVTTGEGNGKKMSKKRAAEKMLELLRNLPPIVPASNPIPVNRLKRKANQPKKKSRNLIKDTQTAPEQKFEPETTEDVNPISRLIQIQQSKKEKEPIYTLREERGASRRREFIMEVSVGDLSKTGSGPNKKLAKRNAAEALLIAMGYSPTPVSTISNNNNNSSKQTSHHFKGKNKQMNNTNNTSTENNSNITPAPPPSTPNVGGIGGRQIVPGLLLVKDNNITNNSTPNNKSNTINLNTTSMSIENLNNMKENGNIGFDGRPRDQLIYLGKVMGFQVQFSDYPKGNHKDFFCLATLDSTEPHQVYHGAGTSLEMAQDQAALMALRAVAEMGLVPSITKKDVQNTANTEGLFLSLNTNEENKSYVNGST